MITVTATETSKIKIVGSDIEFPSFEARIKFTVGLSEKEMNPGFDCFQTYIDGAHPIDIMGYDAEGNYLNFYNSFRSVSLALGTTPESYSPQTLQTAHDKLKLYFESLGYLATIVL